MLTSPTNTQKHDHRERVRVYPPPPPPPPPPPAADHPNLPSLPVSSKMTPTLFNEMENINTSNSAPWGGF